MELRRWSTCTGLADPDNRPIHPLPQLVLLDLKLPKVEGLEVLRRLRAEPRTRLLPIVVLTSSDEQRDIVMSYGLGANSYVRKPVAFEEFVEAARYLGLYWLVLNKPAPRTRIRSRARYALSSSSTAFGWRWRRPRPWLRAWPSKFRHSPRACPCRNQCRRSRFLDP